MAGRNRSSITYDAPPLVEVAMSIQFDPPNGLNQAHLGAFWVTQKHELPRVRALQPITASYDDFGGERQWLPPSLQLALTNEPDCRLQMISLDDQWVCQVQRNRLVLNWRKRSEGYPRFSAAWDRFLTAWEAWPAFLVDYQLEGIRSRLWELTYVNRIPNDRLWEKPSDWPNVFPGLWGGGFSVVEGAELRGFQGRWVWESLDPPAHLYVEPNPGRSAEDPLRDVLLLSLTARGVIREDNRTGKPSQSDLIECAMAFGHDWIVDTFDKITSDSAKKAWGRHVDSE